MIIGSQRQTGGKATQSEAPPLEPPHRVPGSPLDNSTGHKQDDSLGSLSAVLSFFFVYSPRSANSSNETISYCNGSARSSPPFALRHELGRRLNMHPQQRWPQQ